MKDGFWSLVLEPGKTYSKKLESELLIKHAVLDTTVGDITADTRVQVQLCCNTKTPSPISILSVRHNILQTAVDILFTPDDVVSFTTSGSKVPVTLIGSVPVYPEYYHESTSIEDNDSVKVKESKKKKKTAESEVNILSSSKEDITRSNVEQNSLVGNSKRVKCKKSKKDKNINDIIETELKTKLVKDKKNKHQVNDGGSPKEKDKVSRSKQPTSNGVEEISKAAQQGKKRKRTEELSENDSFSAEIVTKSKKKKRRKNNELPNIERNSTGNNSKPDDEQTVDNKKKARSLNIKGVDVEEVCFGDGTEASKHSTVSVYYVARDLRTNKIFDQNTSGPPFRFTVGQKQVMRGWDLGVRGMRIGGKRKITVPPNLALGGSLGTPGTVPKEPISLEVTLVQCSKP